MLQALTANCFLTAHSEPVVMTLNFPSVPPNKYSYRKAVIKLIDPKYLAQYQY